MITNIERTNVRNSLDRENLPTHWQKYFEYETDTTLCGLSRSALLKAVEAIKKLPEPVVNSQQVIAKILTDFGTKSVFHRDFRANHPDSDDGQVLGMQLYDIMLQDDDEWVYYEAQHPGHPFPHAVYFKTRT